MTLKYPDRPKIHQIASEGANIPRPLETKQGRLPPLFNAFLSVFSANTLHILKGKKL